MVQATAGEEVAQASGDTPAAKVADLVAEFESAVANEDPFSGENCCQDHRAAFHHG